MILPQAAMAAVDPVAQALMPEQSPFVWGHGGLKMTPEQAAAMRAQGMDRMRGDYSPVGHWTQGLGRVADNVLGALDAKKAGKAQMAGREADMALAEALPGADDATIARALLDPNVGQGVRQFAEMEYARRQPKQVAPLEVERLAILANDPTKPDFVREAAAAKLRNQNDPLITTTLPGDRFYSGPQSGLAGALGGGGQVSGAQPGGEPPAVLPSDFDFGEGGPASAPGGFRR